MHSDVLEVTGNLPSYFTVWDQVFLFSLYEQMQVYLWANSLEHL